MPEAQLQALAGPSLSVSVPSQSTLCLFWTWQLSFSIAPESFLCQCSRNQLYDSLVKSKVELTWVMLCYVIFVPVSLQ